MDFDFARTGYTALAADKVKEEINMAAKAANPPRYSWRVKPSELADDCIAKLWYGFRWARQDSYDGRMARLFSRGHKAEAGLVGYLRNAGWEVREYSQRLMYEKDLDKYSALEWEAEIPPYLIDVSEDSDHIKRALKRDKWILKQYRIKDFGGHMSGYLDGICRHPIWTNNIWILLEFKTYNTKRFSVLVNKSVRISDPKYYGQIVLYMKYMGLPATLFLAVNKNDDDIWPEIVLPDEGTAISLLQIAHTVATSPVRPARIAESPAFFKCKTCIFTGPCHLREPVDVNCRSCTLCAPIDGGKFYCNKWNAQIPDETALLAGCAQHSPIM